MATNQRGHGMRVRVTVSADRSSGDFVYEDGFHGVIVNDAENTDVAVMDISQVEVELPLVATAAVGDDIYIGNAQALSKVATNHRLVGKVTRIAGDEGVGAGLMWMLVLPQNAVAPSAA
jgi:hypothetical protein